MSGTDIRYAATMSGTKAARSGTAVRYATTTCGTERGYAATRRRRRSSVRLRSTLPCAACTTGSTVLNPVCTTRSTIPNPVLTSGYGTTRLRRRTERQPKRYHTFSCYEVAMPCLALRRTRKTLRDNAEVSYPIGLCAHQAKSGTDVAYGPTRSLGEVRY
eukprot:3403998-Rhodomonas_salina.2